MRSLKRNVKRARCSVPDRKRAVIAHRRQMCIAERRVPERHYGVTCSTSALSKARWQSRHTKRAENNLARISTGSDHRCVFVERAASDGRSVTLRKQRQGDAMRSNNKAGEIQDTCLRSCFS